MPTHMSVPPPPPPSPKESIVEEAEKEYFNACSRAKDGKDSPKARTALEQYKVALQSLAKVCEPHTSCARASLAMLVMPAPAAAQEESFLVRVRVSFTKIFETGGGGSVVLAVGKKFFAPDMSFDVTGLPKVDSSVALATTVALAALVIIAASLAIISYESRR